MRKRQDVARQFLSEWFQPEDTFALLEGLKARNSGLSTDRAVEITTTAFSFDQRVRILHPKEN